MERRRTRAALTISIIFTIYLLNVRNPVHSSNTAKSATVQKKLYQDDFEGHENGKTNLLTIHLGNMTNSEWLLEVRKYKGDWKSELDFILRVRFPDFEDNKVNFSRNSSEIASDSKFMNIHQNISFYFEKNDKFSEFNGNITVDGKYFLDFKSKSIDRDEVYNTKLCYGLVVSLMYILSVGVLVNHYKACLENPAFAGQTSMIMLGLLLLYEFTFAMWQLHKAFSDRVNTGVDFILIAAFWGFISFMLIYSRLLICVFESSIRTQALMGEYGRTRLVSNFQTRVFFMTFFIFMLIVLFSKFYYVTVPILHLFFTPQILQNSFYGYKKSISMAAVTIILLSKCIVSAYFLIYEENFIKYKPDYSLFFTIFSILLIQGIILYWQRFQPRFLVPRKYRPLHYDYYRTKEEEKQLEGLENICNICMTPLNIGKSSEQVVNFSKTLHTPCNHRYHQDCLLHWLEIKLECPTCRSKLPAFEDD